MASKHQGWDERMGVDLATFTTNRENRLKRYAADVGDVVNEIVEKDDFLESANVQVVDGDVMVTLKFKVEE